MSGEETYENIEDLQSNLINMRKKYIKTILKNDRQCNKIELKILEKINFVCEDSNNSNDFSIDETLLKQCCCNKDAENKEMMNKIKHKLKKLDNDVTRVSRVVNCDIYKEIFDGR